MISIRTTFNFWTDLANNSFSARGSKIGFYHKGYLWLEAKQGAKAGDHDEGTKNLENGMGAAKLRWYPSSHPNYIKIGYEVSRKKEWIFIQYQAAGKMSEP